MAAKAVAKKESNKQSRRKKLNQRNGVAWAHESGG
jgi:hypothetical protein